MAGSGLNRIIILILIVLIPFGVSTASAQPPSPVSPTPSAPIPAPPPPPILTPSPSSPAGLPVPPSSRTSGPVQLQSPSPAPAPPAGVIPPVSGPTAQPPVRLPGTPPPPTPRPAPVGSPIPAQPPTVPNETTAASPAAEAGKPGPPSNGPQPSSPGLLSTKRGEVSLNFDDADVYTVIQTIFGGVLKVNYIIDPKVKGRVNFRSVSPVAKEDVLTLMEVILRLNGIGVVEEGGLYRIIPIAEMPREPTLVKIGREADKVNLQGLGLLQVVPLKYLPSSDMVKVLTPFLSTNAVLVDVPKINFLIIVDTDINIKRLLQLVELFDSDKLKKTKPEVHVYPVQNGKAKDLAAMLNQIFLGAMAPPRTGTTTTPSAAARPGTPTTPTTPSLSPTMVPGQTTPSPFGLPFKGEPLVSEITRIYADDITNSLVILATPGDHTLILETLNKLDQVPRQVMIEVLMAEISLTDELKFGLEWSLTAPLGEYSLKISNSFIPIPSSSTTTSSQPSGFTFTGVDQAGIVRAKLNTLATQGKTNVLASPHIMAADNREAKIQIGNQIPVVTSVITTGVASASVQYKDTGVILKIKPTINDSGLVSMELTQEISDFYYKTIGTAGDFPVITKREASSYMVVQDGQTVVVGGLISEKTNRSRSGLPFLSKIPVLGYLFGYTDDIFDRSEIVLLLTPRVVKTQKEAENLTNVYIHRLDKNFHKSLKKNQIVIPKDN